MLSHRREVLSSKTGQEGLLRRPLQPERAACCPVRSQVIEQVATLPEHGPQAGKQPCEAVCPVAAGVQEAQQHVHQQRRPYLPLDGLAAVPKEVAQVQRLLDLLEEGLDAPARLVQIADARRRPLEVVGEERHLPVFSINLDDRDNPPHALRVVLPLAGIPDLNDVVAQDAARGLFQPPFDAAQLHALLHPADPEDAALGQVEKMGVVDIGHVKYGDFARFQASAQLMRLGAVVSLGRIHDREGRQETLQIQPQVQLGGRLAPPVLRPVHAVGEQLDRRGVQHMHRPFEAAGQAAELHAAEPRMQRLEVRQHPPEKLLGHFRVARPIRVRQPVPAGRLRSPNRRQRGPIRPQRIGHVVQSDRVSELRVQHAHDMAPRRDVPRPDSVRTRKLRHQIRRNEFTDLTEYGTLTPGCTGWHITTSFGLVAKKIVASQSATTKFPSPRVGRQ